MFWEKRKEQVSMRGSSEESGTESQENENIAPWPVSEIEKSALHNMVRC